MFSIEFASWVRVMRQRPSRQNATVLRNLSNPMGKRFPKNKTPRSSFQAPADHGLAPVLRMKQARAKSRRRIWAFRLIAMTLIPILLLGVLEVGMRIGGFGYDTCYFMPIPGREQICGNPRFGWRFFPPELARMPLSFALHEKKAPGAFRVFVLGSSAAQGFPDPSFSFARILEAMLLEAFPHAHFEVVNTAMVAVNSHVVLSVAGDCAQREPDLFVIYEGNNEVVGPFGPGTVFAGFSERLWAIRTQLAMSRSRVVQAAQKLVAAFSTSEIESGEWKGMEFFLDRQVSEDDPRLTKVYEHFKQNLLDICNVSRSAGADVLLCTVGVNVRDCAPFASKHRDGISADELTRWETNSTQAEALERGGRHQEALRLLQEAEAIDAGHAALKYRIARCCFSMGKFEEAKRYYEKARDLDLLRFRTDSHENGIVRQVAATAGDGVELVDIEKIMAESVPEDHGSAGRELFYEHCHLSFRGNYVIARSLFGHIISKLPKAMRDKAAGSPGPCSIERCMERLGYTPFGEETSLKTIAGLLEHPPFTGAIDSNERISAERTRLAELEGKKTPETFAQYSKQFEKAISISPDDAVLHANYAALLSIGDKHAEAAVHLRNALKSLPFDPVVISDLGNALIRAGEVANGEAVYRTALESTYCDPPCQSNVHFNLGLVAHKVGRKDEARSNYEAALRFRPNRLDARTNLGQLLMESGDAERAIEQFRFAVENEPTNAVHHRNLASALAYFKNTDDAISVLRDAKLKLPRDFSIHAALVDLLTQNGRLEEAIISVTDGLHELPQSADMHVKAALVLSKSGKTNEAIEHLREALRIEPHNAAAKQLLELIGNRNG